MASTYAWTSADVMSGASLARLCGADPLASARQLRAVADPAKKRIALDCYEAALDCCRALLDVAPLSDGARARLLDLAAADGALAVAVTRLSTPRETPATK